MGKKRVLDFSGAVLLPLESILSIFVAEAILTIAGYPRLALARVRMFRRY